MGYLVAEMVLVLAGAVIAWLLMPLLRQDDSLDLPVSAELLMRWYPAIVIAFFGHAATSWAVIPRLGRRGCALWVATGVLLPLLLVVVPMVAYSLVYGDLLRAVRS